MLKVASALVVAAVALLLLAAPAHADAYRYWGYYQLKDGAWTFAQKGPAETTPADGSVEGWRFAVADESSTRTPRVVPTFDSLCGTTDKTDGNKLVGLVVDFGRPADGPDGTSAPPAPIGQCVSVPTAATGSDVMAAAGLTLRLDKSLTCAINGWPATGCGDPVKPVPAAAASPDASITLPAADATTQAASTNSDSDSGGIPTAAWVGIGVALVVGAVLVLLAMRRGNELKD
ncbi:SCO2322 family protein [Angustibacter sp. McL0619]|uniref:SCO2322 family protein n=1 Tax=Angustibacter sp. McL0619 TaxID=3415676 RepID=UPI003CF8C0CF